MVNITLSFPDGQQRKYEKGTTLLTISHDLAATFATQIVAAKLNNEIKDLQVAVDENSTVEFLDLRTDPGIKVYQRSLTFVMITAAQELFPGCEVTVEHSLSKRNLL